MKTRTHSRRTARKAAATSDVIPATSTQKGIPVKWRTAYRRLTELLEHLQQERQVLEHDAAEETPSFSLHQADAGTDTYDRDLALGMLSAEQDAVYQVEQALDRIRQGTYGICELTGKPINRARLDEIPWTRFSVSAEAQLERQGMARRASLGPRESVARVKVPGESEQESEE